MHLKPLYEELDEYQPTNFSDDEDEDNLLDICCPAGSHQSKEGGIFCRLINCCFPCNFCYWKGLCKMTIFCAILFFIYLIFSASQTSLTSAVTEQKTFFNSSKATTIIYELCEMVHRGEYAGGYCESLCTKRNWSIMDFHEGGSKKVLKLHENGKDIILKMHSPFSNNYDQIDERVDDEEFINKILEIVNEQMLGLGWPSRYKNHLLKRLWPTYDSNRPFSAAEKRSIWALLQQDEYINLRVLPLTRVTPQILGTCGHAYRVEYLIPFKMKSYYMNLKAKILVHLMGTLKLFHEFLNEPLQWCDVKFENLGLSADYPKRFVILDSDMLFTESKLKAILTSQTCTNNSQCSFFDCESVCVPETGYCSTRTNDNIDVFCKKLVNQMFGTFWSKSNKYLAACHPDLPLNATKRLNELRLVWSWSLSDV